MGFWEFEGGTSVRLDPWLVPRFKVKAEWNNYSYYKNGKIKSKYQSLLKYGLGRIGSRDHPLGLGMVYVRYPEKCPNNVHLSIKKESLYPGRRLDEQRVHCANMRTWVHIPSPRVERWAQWHMPRIQMLGGETGRSPSPPFSSSVIQAQGEILSQK